MGLGITELLIVVAIVVMLFGPAAIVGWVAYTMGKSQGESGAAPSEKRDSAFDAARERFARGEIDRQEFDDIKATLGY